MRPYLLWCALFFACRPSIPEESSILPSPVSVKTPSPLSAAPLPEVSSSPSPASEELNEAFAPELLDIAAEYPSYGRVDDFYLWAPNLCGAPMVQAPKAYASASADEGTHGKKIYSLFAGLRGPKPTFAELDLGVLHDQSLIPKSPGQKAYLDIAKGKPIPKGLALVKESWRPEVVLGDHPTHRFIVLVVVVLSLRFQVEHSEHTAI